MNHLRSPRFLFALGVLVPVLLVSFAVVLTIFHHVAACPLCIVQRMLYLAISLVSLWGLLFAPIRTIRVIAAFLGSTAAAVGVAITGYQIYLQHNPFTASCGDGTAWWELLVERAGQGLPVLFKADGLCSDSTATLLGFHIVEWSLLAFFGLFVLCLLALFPRQNG
ncbi:MAG: disulfide bond formation protein B [Microbacteriaceae bacterium]|nr:disulfide bond formation protein B [Microbacteriaceae bacterium]